MLSALPNRIANDSLRTRFHLTEEEVEQLLKVARCGRYGKRDHLMVLMAFRHGLIVSVSRPGRSDIGSLAEYWFYL